MPGRFDLKTLLANRADPNKILTPLVDQFLLTNDLSEFTRDERKLMLRIIKQWSRERDTELHSPSSAAACLRQQMLTHFGFKGQEVDDPYLKNIFDDGNWRHLRWHMIFKRMERAGLLRVVHIEDRLIYQPWLMGGTPDDVLDIPVGGEYVRVVVDVKSAHDEKFKAVVQSNRPVDGHEWQLTDYMVGLHIGRGIMWYENKNTQRYTEVTVHRDPEIVRELRRRYAILRESRATRVLPEHGCSMKMNDMTMRRCRQRLNCVKLTNAGKTQV